MTHLKALQEIIFDQFSHRSGIRSKDDIKLSTDIVKDLGADSLDAIELVMEIENAFHFSVPNEEIGGLTEVSTIIQYIESRVGPSPDGGPGQLLSKYEWLDRNRESSRFGSWEEEIAYVESLGYELAPPDHKIGAWMDTFAEGEKPASLYVLRGVDSMEKFSSFLGCPVSRLGYPAYFRKGGGDPTKEKEDLGPSEARLPTEEEVLKAILSSGFHQYAPHGVLLSDPERGSVPTKYAMGFAKRLCQVMHDNNNKRSQG